MWTVVGTKSELLEGSGVGGPFWVRREGAEGGRKRGRAEADLGKRGRVVFGKMWSVLGTPQIRRRGANISICLFHVTATGFTLIALPVHNSLRPRGT